MRKTILRWELVGIVLIFLVGTSLHFVFEWTNYWRPAGLIAAVNESTWEHFKMGFWPGLLYALIEYPFIKKHAKNFLVAKTIGLFTMPIITTILFYGYTGITGQHYLWVDIIIFFLSVAGGQMVSYKFMTKDQMGLNARNISIVGLVIMITAFSLLSYYPLINFLFKHPESDHYGILDDYDDHSHDENGE
jgi:hypothetical protein